MGAKQGYGVQDAIGTLLPCLNWHRNRAKKRLHATGE